MLEQTNSGFEIVPAQQRDVDAFYTEPLKYRIKAWAGRQDGKTIGLGGTYFLEDGTRVGFLIVGPEAKRMPKTVYQTAKRFLEVLKFEGVRSIRAVADPEIEPAERFLTRLGFVATTLADGQKIYQWQW